MSVLRINQNPVAINSLRNLQITGAATAKTLEKLSSGLRINRAADDAAGLSISEKLRAQIRGLNRASANALDGISLIQTAEGALNEIHTILQRMRELAVQAANGIYTSGDRATIQLEVSQLVEEINRISRTTEFNSKKLLDGTMGALISTDDYTKIRAAVVGNVGNGGNFVMQAFARDVGQLQVMKSDVFSTTLETDAVGSLNYLHTYRAGAEITSAGPDGIGNTGIYVVEVPIDGFGSVAVQSTQSGTFRISGANIAGSAMSIGRSFQAEELTIGDKLILTVQTQTGVESVSIVLLSLGTSFAGFAALMSTALNNSSANISSVNFNALGLFSINVSNGGSTLSILNTQFVDADESGSDFYISFSGSGQSNFYFSSVQVSFFNNGASSSQTLARAGGASISGQEFSIGTAATGAINIKFDTRFNWAAVTAAGSTLSDVIGWTRDTGTNSLQTYGSVWQTAPVPENATFIVSAISNRAYAVFEFDNAAYSSLVAAGWNQNNAIAASRGFRVNNSDGNATSSISATFAGSTGSSLENVRLAFDGILQAGETATFNMSTSNVLTADQNNTLASLSRFQANDVFNGRKNVEMTIYLRGTTQSATINLNSNDTFEEMANKISLALWNEQGTGIINSGILNPEVMPDLVHVNTIGMAKGTMSIVTPVPGAELVFSADESLLKALSLIEIQVAHSPIYSINAYNLEKNQSVGSVIVDSNEINGLLPGVRVFFDNTLGLKLDAQPPIALAGGLNTLNSFAYAQPFERPAISLSSTIESFFIHIAPREFSLQTGANQGQTISSFIADTSAEPLGVEGLLIVTSELAQEAISIVDVAINRVSNQRSRLGAIQNRLESTIRNLDVASENLTASESRIRDVDIAAETMAMTRNQILLQAGIAALAQANALPQNVLQLLR